LQSSIHNFQKIKKRFSKPCKDSTATGAHEVFGPQIEMMEPETQEFDDLPDPPTEPYPLPESIGEDKSSQPVPFAHPNPVAEPGNTASSFSMPPPPAPDRSEHKMKVKARLDELRWGIGTKVVYDSSTCLGNSLQNSKQKTW